MSFLKNNAQAHLRISFFATTLLLFLSCQQSGKDETQLATNTSTGTSIEKNTLPQEKREISQDFKDYWYAGTAEITSYRLEQARYGEMREGTAALIFVTEDFLPKEQVKADRSKESNIPVLKLNATKTFNTGIYPYSIMTSTFYPVFQNRHAIKVSQSMQEWCGHVYAQLNNRDRYEIESHSYFEGEADQKISLAKDILENELWTQLRVDPSQLPTGIFQAIPDLSYVRMKHIDVKAYQAKGTLSTDSYTIEYPTLQRSLRIQFEAKFPYKITSWEETFISGYGANAKTLTTKATAIKTIKSPYWSKNSTSDNHLRKELGL
ncbi:MAG: hypothetical protein ACI828_000854 [Flavobacteriales bacterium]|jgi:hypothetical protein